MKCNSCKSEWNTTKSTMDKCPFCGALLDVKVDVADNTQLHMVLKHIHREYREVFFNPQKLNAYINDMFTGPERVKRALKQLILSDIVSKVLGLSGLDNADKDLKIGKIKQYYNEEYYLPLDIMDRFIRCFMYALGYSDNIDVNVRVEKQPDIIVSTKSQPISSNTATKVFTKDDYVAMGSPINLIIPNSYTAINNKEFRGNESLVSIVIPNSITSIDDGVFSGCHSLVSITIPNSVTSIGGYAFSGCNSLESITIPNSVTSIGEYAFNGCHSLAPVIIPNSVTSIGMWAFSFCDSLMSIIIPDSVTRICEKTFTRCTSLTSITISDSVTSIDDGAFEDCWHLASINIPCSLTSIGNKAFRCCFSLSLDVTIPDSVTYVGDEAFRFTSIKSVNIPDSVIHIGENAFEKHTIINVSISNPMYSKLKNEYGDIVMPK